MPSLLIFVFFSLIISTESEAIDLETEDINKFDKIVNQLEGKISKHIYYTYNTVKAGDLVLVSSKKNGYEMGVIVCKRYHGFKVKLYTGNIINVDKVNRIYKACKKYYRNQARFFPGLHVEFGKKNKGRLTAVFVQLPESKSVLAAIISDIDNDLHFCTLDEINFDI